MGVEVNAVPVVGQPIAYGVGFLALVFYAFSGLFGEYFLTLAHEGGHALTVKAVLRPLRGIRLYDNGGGLTRYDQLRWSFGNVLVFAAGYAAPPLLGLVGAALIAYGNAQAVLIISLLFGFLSLIAARNGLAVLIPLLVVLGTLLVLLRGTPYLQAAVALGIAWFLLISGAIDPFRPSAARGDAQSLARRTLIPGFVWQLAWMAIGVVALIAGGRLLLVPGAEA